MVRPIVVGAHPKRYEPGPVSLGLKLSRLTGAPVYVVGVFWFDGTPQRTASEDYRQVLKDRVWDELERPGHGPDGGLTEIRFQVEYGPDKGALHKVASRVGAGLIVVGAAHRSVVRRMVPGTTPAGVVRGAPCPVAVAPPEVRDGRLAPERVGVLVQAPGTCAALHAATAIARHTGAGLIAYRDGDLAEPVLERAIAEHAGDIETEVRPLPGGGVAGLERESRALDLLVGAPPVAGLSGSLTPRLACPLVVVPKGAEGRLVGLFGARVSARSDVAALPEAALIGGSLSRDA